MVKVGVQGLCLVNERGDGQQEPSAARTLQPDARETCAQSVDPSLTCSGNSPFPNLCKHPYELGDLGLWEHSQRALGIHVGKG